MPDPAFLPPPGIRMKPDPKGKKLFVLDTVEESRVPFLRGILTRSLQKAGMPFEQAYRAANRVRDRVWGSENLRVAGDVAYLTTQDLRTVVEAYLSAQGAGEVLERYRAGARLNRYVRVADQEGHYQPFSKALLGQTLETCALPPERSFAIATHIERDLLRSGRTDLTSTDLAELAYHYLLDHEDEEAAHRYLVWLEYSRSGRPMILLFGGTTGCGKSTISSEVAHRLNIVRTQSTDMLREVMRLMVPPRLLPTLHVSSYLAWQALPRVGDEEINMIDGYLTQSEQVSVGIEGVMQRAEREQVSLILEGVHIYPDLQHRLIEQNSAIVVPFILAVLKRKKLRKRLLGRGQQVASRRSERYLENFETIWDLQTYLLSEADRYQVPIIPNDDQEETIRLVMENIMEVLVREYRGRPEDVFGTLGAGEEADA